MPLFILYLLLVHTIVQIALGAVLGQEMQAMVAIIALPVMLMIAGGAACVVEVVCSRVVGY